MYMERRYSQPKATWLNAEGVDTVFQVRRRANGECSPFCDFNLGRCAVGWRHDSGGYPWDNQCSDGDRYRLGKIEPERPPYQG
ncbi:MAG: hypothetical protein ACE5FN_11480 [Leptospirillia bacterium]